jgi:hypothetical protein
VVTATLAAHNSPAALIEHRVQARLNQSQKDYSKHSTLVRDGFFKNRGTLILKMIYNHSTHHPIK